VNNPTLRFVGAVIALLVVGLFFSVAFDGFPVVQQVSNPEGATGVVTQSKGATLFAFIVVVLGLIGGVTTTLALGLWLLSREVKQATEQPPQPFELLSMGTQGNSTGSLLVNNALYLVLGAGAVMTLIAIVFVLSALS